MSSRKYVWTTCCICKGTGVEIDMVSVQKNGYTHYVEHANECTNCSGDKGHRTPVYAPDPEPVKPLIADWRPHDWWGHDGALDANIASPEQPPAGWGFDVG